MLTEEEINAFVRRIVSQVAPEKVIIFGSYAKGTPTHLSDLDLLVVADSDLPMANRVDALRHIFDRSLHHVDIHVYTPEEIDAFGGEELSFISSVLRTGKVTYQRA
jgi:uncharacterized protein